MSRLITNLRVLGWSSVLPKRTIATDYPPYEIKTDETELVKRKRLLYQSRKRGISENGLLLSTFAAKYLSSFTKDQLDQYDLLLNHPSNEWDIYYWATGKEDTPSYYNNGVMELLKKHTQDKNSTHFKQPELSN